MARGFGTTEGTASTDKIQIPSSASTTLRSYSCWVYSIAAGTGGRCFDRLTTELLFNSSNASFGWTYTAYWSGTNIQYTMADGDMPALNEWHHLFCTYDGSSTSNIPIIYLDGVSQTFSEDQGPPTGTLDTSTNDVYVGSRAGGDRVNNGRLAEFAMWDIIQPASVALSLASGFSPDHYPSGLTQYPPMLRATRDHIGGVTTVTGALVKNHPRIIYPRRKHTIFTPAAVGGATNPKGPLGHPLHGPFAGPVGA